MKKPLISILVPMYNESSVVDTFFETLKERLKEDLAQFEYICVDDGSKDDTLQRLLKRAAEDSRIKVIALSRNFGKEAAMSAALDHAQGDACIPMDADLQDPPELVNQMIQVWQGGVDVVLARRANRDCDSALKRNTAKLFYRFFNAVSEYPIPAHVGDYRLMSRRVVEVVKQLPERERFMKGIFSWPGFHSETIEYVRAERTAGVSKFNYWKLWNFALSGITSFSTIPIRVGTYVGLLLSACAFIYAAYIVMRTLISGIEVPGYASLVTIILFLGGIQLCVMGLLGEYLGRVYQEVKRRPTYVIDKLVGFEAESSSTILFYDDQVPPLNQVPQT